MSLLHLPSRRHHVVDVVPDAEAALLEQERDNALLELDRTRRLCWDMEVKLVEQESEITALMLERDGLNLLAKQLRKGLDELIRDIRGGHLADGGQR